MQAKQIIRLPFVARARTLKTVKEFFQKSKGSCDSGTAAKVRNTRVKRQREASARAMKNCRHSGAAIARGPAGVAGSLSCRAATL